MDNHSNITSITKSVGGSSERDRILTAAIEEVGDSGLFLFSLESVARRAQMTRYDVDQHFSDRRSLVIATGNHVAAQLVTATRIAALNHPGDPLQCILAIARCHFDATVSPIEHIAVWSAFYGATRQNNDYQSIFQSANEQIFELIERAVLELLPHSYPTANASALSNAIFGAIDQYWLDSLHLRRSDQIDTYNKTAFQAIEHLLFVIFPNENGHLSAHSSRRTGVSSPIDQVRSRNSLKATQWETQNQTEHKRFLEAGRRVIWKTDSDALTPLALAEELQVQVESLSAVTEDWDQFQFELLEFILNENSARRVRAANNASNTAAGIIAYIEEYATCDSARLREDQYWHTMLHHPRLKMEMKRIDAFDDASVIKHLGEQFDDLILTWKKPFDGETLAVTMLGLINRAWTSCTMIEGEAEKRTVFERVVLEARSHLRTLFPESFTLDIVPWTGGLNIETDWRSQIYQATCRAIAEHGIDRCDFVDVANLCGLSAEDIRKAFATPRQLHVHTLTWLVNTLTKPIEEIMHDHSRSDPQKLLDFGEAYFDPTVTQPILTKAWHIYHGSSSRFEHHGDLTTSTDGETIENLTRLVTPLVRRYKIDISPGVVAAMLHGVLDQHFMDSAMTDHPQQQRERALRIYGDMVRWLFPEEYSTHVPSFNNTTMLPVVSLPDANTGQSRRERLIDAAIECVCVMDLDKIRQSHIADRPGLSENSIGYHFGSLGFLMQSALASCLESITSTVDEAIRERSGDPAKDLEALLERLFDPIGKIPVSTRVWIAYWGAARHNPMYLAVLDEVDGAIREYTNELVSTLVEKYAPQLNGEIVSSAGIGLYEYEWDKACKLPVTADLSGVMAEGLKNCLSYYKSLFPDAFSRSNDA